jgi:hypothetical protein
MAAVESQRPKSVRFASDEQSARPFAPTPPPPLEVPVAATDPAWAELHRLKLSSARAPVPKLRVDRLPLVPNELAPRPPPPRCARASTSESSSRLRGSLSSRDGLSRQSSRGDSTSRLSSRGDDSSGGGLSARGPAMHVEWKYMDLDAPPSRASTSRVYYEGRRTVSARSVRGGVGGLEGGAVVWDGMWGLFLAGGD